MKTPQEMAQLAYETFVSVPDRRTELFGVYTWPGWENLSRDEYNAWIAVVSAVGVEFLNPDHVGNDDSL